MESDAAKVESASSSTSQIELADFELTAASLVSEEEQTIPPISGKKGATHAHSKVLALEASQAAIKILALRLLSGT